MPKFPKNTGFKLPGIGSREIDTPGNFRKSQKVEDVGYCDNTESHMLPPGSSPLLASDEPKDWLVPDYYHTTYTSSVGDAHEPEDKPDPDKPVDPNYGVNVIKGEEGTDAVPEKTITTPGSKKGGTGKSYETRWGELTPEKQKEFGTVENFQKAGEKWWSEQNATTEVIPGVAAIPGTADTYTFTKDGVQGDYKDAFCAQNPGHAACK